MRRAMRAEDWVCPKCGEDMRKKDGILSCDSLHCPLVYAPTINSLPEARRVGWRKYEIEGEEGRWCYAVRQHKGALDRKPAPNVVVASIEINDWLHVRAFQRVAGSKKER